MLYQLNDINGESLFLLNTIAKEDAVDRAWFQVHLMNLDGDDEIHMIIGMLNEQSYPTERVFITEVNP